jgi:hypothetical protein
MAGVTAARIDQLCKEYLKERVSQIANQQNAPFRLA